MATSDDEDRLLRSVALQNAQSILAARQRAEEELVRAKEALERRTQELAHSVALMRATLESTTDGILVTDGTGKVTGCNEKYLKMWRLSRAVTDGREHRRLLEDTGQQFNDPQQYRARVEEIYTSSPAESYDLLELIDGRVFERFSRIQFVEGRNVGRVWSFRDITERKRAEEAVQKQSEWLRVTLASIGDAVITTDTEGCVTSLNPVAQLLTGWTLDDAQGTPLGQVFNIINEESRLPVENPALRSLREGRIVGLANHTILIAKDRTERAVDDSAAPIRDEQGKVIGVVLIFRDVTEKRQSEQTAHFLAEASAFLAELSDYRSTLQKIASLAVPTFADWCAVDILNDEGSLERVAVAHADPSKIRLVNELHRRYPPRPDDGYGVTKALRSGKAELGTAIPAALLASGTANEEHVRILEELGLRSYIAVPLRSRTKTLGVLTFVTAGSGRVYAGNDLRAAEDLANRALVAIDNATLLGALKDADQRKDEFLAILAHELRNPLAPIRNAIQILHAKSPPEPESQWARDMIDRQVQQMTRLVDDLLDVSRISRGAIELRKERVALAAVVNSAIETSRPLIEKCGHELIVTMPATPIYLEADLTRLSQVLLNLLNNAAKYTDPGGRIWLTAEQNGPQVVLRVRDTGVGIPAEMLARVFEMFAQVDRSLERSQGGLGIGLTLVRQLVQMHGGTVEAHSEGSGHGSTFVVRLPVVAEKRALDTSQEPSDGNKTAAPQRRILVVDDNEDAANSLTMLLRLMGNEVSVAHDGLKAVEAAATFQPEVILLDIGLPKLNGYEACRRIRAQPGGAASVIVALTGWGQEEDIRRSKEAGFDAHLVKPVDLDALQALLVHPEFIRHPDTADSSAAGRRR